VAVIAELKLAQPLHGKRFDALNDCAFLAMPTRRRYPTATSNELNDLFPKRIELLNPKPKTKRQSNMFIVTTPYFI
tara:strand:- start:1750 stop:1977 length:228 start_codon:yes stop_codon:yes gene_type:complete